LEFSKPIETRKLSTEDDVEEEDQRLIIKLNTFLTLLFQPADDVF